MEVDTMTTHTPAQVADACLLAAAPELLAFVTTFIARIDAICEGDEHLLSDEGRAFLAQGRAAIAKATATR